MKDNRWVRISRHIYARLLNLYPKAHRNEYGADMLQVFTDECRACFQEGKGFKLLPLWLRTLGDLIVNVFKEHVDDPNSAAGLMEAEPNAPLPWKGVFLVLVPGLIFFVSQIAQLNGEDWFFLMVYRAAYVLILPVIAVWIWKRKFPIWGLVPMGLLFKTLSTLFWSRTQNLEMKYSYLSVIRWNEYNKLQFPLFLNLIITLAILLCTIGLVWLIKRRAGLTKMTRVWLGIFCLLIFISFWVMGFNAALNENDLGNIFTDIFELAASGFYSQGIFLLLILLGTFLSKRHGRLAVLLPLGFLLPTIIYGRVSDAWPDIAAPGFGFMVSVAATALIYRFLVALAVPLWIVRSATSKMQNHAWIVSIAVVMGVQLIFNCFLIFFDGFTIAQPFMYVTTGILEQLTVGAGLVLAVVLYGTAPNTQSAQQEMGMLDEGTA